METYDIVIMIAILIGAVVFVDIVKRVVENIRKRNVTIEQYTNENGETVAVAKKANGKEYNTLSFIYQLIAFLLSCGALFAYMYVKMKMQLETSIVSSVLVGSGEAKVYEVLETVGRKGLLVLILNLFTKIKNMFKNGKDTTPTNEQIDQAIDNATEIVENAMGEIAEETDIDEDVVAKMSEITGKSLDFCRNLLKYNIQNKQ